MLPPPPLIETVAQYTPMPPSVVYVIATTVLVLAALAMRMLLCFRPGQSLGTPQGLDTLFHLVQFAVYLVSLTCLLRRSPWGRWVMCRLPFWSLVVGSCYGMGGVFLLVQGLRLGIPLASFLLPTCSVLFLGLALLVHAPARALLRRPAVEAWYGAKRAGAGSG